MKKILFSLAILLLPSFVISATRNVVPRATHEGSLGTPAKYWSSIHVDSGSVNEKLYVGSMTVYGTITTTNAVTASVFYGDGSQLSGITAGGGGGGGQIKVVIDSGTLFTTVSTINVTQRDFASAFTAATWTVRLSSNVARLDGSSQTFNLSSVLNLNAPQLYFNGTNGFGGGQDFAEFNVSNTNPRYFIVRNNNNAGSANLMMLADSTLGDYALMGNLGSTWNDSNNGAYLQGSAYLALVGSGRYGIIDRNPLGGVQTRYLMYFTSGTVGINTSTQSAYFEVHSTANWNGELPFQVLVSSPNGKRIFSIGKASSVIETPIYVSSMTSIGTITASQFRGDGSALTGISASAVQSLPLIAGDTGYAATYSTKTWSATQTFKSTMTFNAVAVFNSSITVMSSSTIAGVIFSNSTAEEPPYVSRSTGSIIATNVNIMAASDQNNLCPLNIWDKTGQLVLNLGTDGDLHVNDFGGGTLGSKFASIYDGVTPESGQVNGIVMQNYSQKSGNFSSIISQNGINNQTAGIYLVNVTSAGAFGGSAGNGSRLGRILFYTGTAEDDFVYERGRFDEHGNFVVGFGTGSSKMDVKTGSITVRGTGAGIYSSGDICSSGTFRGDGSKLTGITASAVQSLPLIAGDTGYFAIYSTRTISATQTFQSSVTFSSTSLSIGGNLYHFQSSAPAVNTVLRYDAGGKVFWGKDGGGGGTASVAYNQVFGAAQANLVSITSSPYISNSTSSASAGLFYDETSTQTATWSTILTGYQGGQLNADIIYTSSATAGTVNWGVYVECKSVDEVINYDTNDFDVVNSTSVTVGSTSMMPMKATSVLTNNDGCVDGDIMRIKLERRAGEDDTAIGKARMRFMRIYE